MKTRPREKAVLENVFNASAAGIMIIGHDGTILMANPASAELFGYEDDELVDKNIEVLIPHSLKDHCTTYISKQTTPPLQDLKAWGLKKNSSKISLNLGLSPTEIGGQKATLIFLWESTPNQNDLITPNHSNPKPVENNRKFEVLINNLEGIVFRCRNNRDYDFNFYF